MFLPEERIAVVVKQSQFHFIVKDDRAFCNDRQECSHDSITGNDDTMARKRVRRKSACVRGRDKERGLIQEIKRGERSFGGGGGVVEGDLMAIDRSATELEETMERHLFMSPVSNRQFRSVQIGTR